MKRKNKEKERRKWGERDGERGKARWRERESMNEKKK